MAGIKRLRKLQLGLENPAGTPVAATTIWRGTGTLEDKREPYFPDEDIGYVSPVNRAVHPFTLGQLDLDEVPATFQQLPYILAMGVDGVVSGTSDGAGTDKIYTYTFPTTALKTPKTYTWEGGDNEQVEQMAYAFAESFKISGKPKQPWMMSATLIGNSVDVLPAGFTAAIALPTVEEILFQKTKLYIDAVSGTIGTTQIPCTLYEFSLDVTTGFNAVFAANGDLGFCKINGGMPEIKLHLVFEHNATSIAQKAAWRALTPKQIRIKGEGSAFTTAGTKYTNHACVIDLAGLWEKIDKLGENNGNDVLEGDFRVAYDPTAAKYAVIEIANQLASLT
jgi:hypothetical protein